MLEMLCLRKNVVYCYVSMKTLILHPSDLFDSVKRNLLKKLIQRGGLVIFPTETVYGIGGYACHEKAAVSIYAAKGRPSDNPLIVHLAYFNQVEKYAYIDHPSVVTLADAFWPGPLTLILRKKESIPMSVTGGLSTVAIRIPSHSVARALLEFTELPIAAPSANLSGKPSSTSFEHVLLDFNGKVDVIIDGGDASIGLESTVVDMTTETPVILRPGSITQAMIEEVLRRKVVDQSESHGDNAPKSPGMKYKHYAPMAVLQVVRGQTETVKSYLQTQTKLDPELVVLGPSHLVSTLIGDNHIDLGPLEDPSIIAKNLFSAFRHLDKLKVKRALIVAIPEVGLGRAIMNRVKKASNNNIVDLD